MSKPLCLQDLADWVGAPLSYLIDMGCSSHPHGVCIPYYTAEWELAAKRIRTALKGDERFRWEKKGTSNLPYGRWLYHMGQKAGYLWLVEGESDCWTLWRHGEPALGIPGANAFGCVEAADVEGIGALYLWQEEDQGGRQFVQGMIARLQKLDYPGRVYRTFAPSGMKDPLALYLVDPEGFKAAMKALRHHSTALGLHAPSPPAPRPARAEPPQPPPNEVAEGESNGRAAAPPAATRLVQLALDQGVELWHTPDGVGCLTLKTPTHHEHWPLRTRGARAWLWGLLWDKEGRAAGSQALADALGVLDSLALRRGPEHPMYTRVGEWEGRLYLDLANDLWSVYEIGPEGWGLCKDPPVRFRRTNNLHALPEPLAGARLDELAEFCNVPTPELSLLARAWCLAAARPTGPFPILIITGQAGSAKTTTAKFLKTLIDPHKAKARNEPKTARDVYIAANGGWVLAYDNLSRMEFWLSDVLCQISSGGSHSTRANYTDDEEVILSVQRPVLLTSIEDIATRPDLLSRSLLLNLPPLRPGQRRTDMELQEHWKARHPFLLGALLDGLSAALRWQQRVPEAPWPRLADFCHWCMAAEAGGIWPGGSFWRAWEGNQQAAVENALQASPLVDPLRRFLLARDGEWEGTAGELLSQLAAIAPPEVTKQKGWPGAPHVLSNRLQNLAPALAGIGITVGRGRSSDAESRRLITLTGPRSPAG